LRQTYCNYRLVLVDDGCTDDTVAIARRSVPQERLTVLPGDGNLWWAGALQLGFEYLVSEHIVATDAVLIVNDDVTFEPEFLANGVALLKAHPGACFQAMGVDRLGSVVDRGAIADTVRLRFRAAEHGEAPNCLSTRGLLMSGATFMRSQGFRPRWLPHYLSDYEFTLRLARQGVPLIVDARFQLVADYATTGEETFNGTSLRAFLVRSLSNRAKYNPTHWSALAMLVSPWWAAPVLVMRIWLGFARRAMRAAQTPAVSAAAAEHEQASTDPR